MVRMDDGGCCGRELCFTWPRAGGIVSRAGLGGAMLPHSVSPERDWPSACRLSRGDGTKGSMVKRGAGGLDRYR